MYYPDEYRRIPEAMRNMPHDPESEAAELLHAAVSQAAKTKPADTVLAAMKMLHGKSEELFDVDAYRENEQIPVEMVDGMDGMEIVATLPMRNAAGLGEDITDSTLPQ